MKHIINKYGVKVVPTSVVNTWLMEYVERYAIYWRLIDLAIEFESFPNKGQAIDEIGRSLGMSKTTVDLHLSEMIQKGVLIDEEDQLVEPHTKEAIFRKTLARNAGKKASKARYNKKKQPEQVKLPVKRSTAKKKNMEEAIQWINDNFAKDQKTLELMIEWVEMRRIKGAVTTVKAMQRATTRLRKFCGGSVEVAREIITKSIDNSWTDLYPLKTMQKKKEKDDSYTETYQKLKEQFT